MSLEVSTERCADNQGNQCVSGAPTHENDRRHARSRQGGRGRKPAGGDGTDKHVSGDLDRCRRLRCRQLLDDIAASVSNTRAQLNTTATTNRQRTPEHTRRYRIFAHIADWTTVMLYRLERRIASWLQSVRNIAACLVSGAQRCVTTSHRRRWGDRTHGQKLVGATPPHSTGV